MTNYKAMAERIRSAKSVDELDKLDSKLDKLYLAGVFTTKELTRLDLLIVDYHIQITGGNEV